VTATPRGSISRRNRRHHNVGSRVDHRNIVVDFIRDALEGARTRRSCSLVRSSLPRGIRKLRTARTAEDCCPLGDARSRDSMVRCPGRFLAAGAGQAVISRRKTIRAVIMRTIIEGTTDMRESPDWSVLSMTAGGRVQARRSMSAFISCAATRRTSSRQR